jgi:hypothetical protein
VRTLYTITLLVCSGLIIASPTLTLAQGRMRGRQGWSASDTYGRLYDPSKVEVVKGKVLEVRRVTPMRGMSEGVEIVLRSATGEVTAHLGPVWFLDDQQLQVKKGDTVDVAGSSVTLRGKNVLLAASVRRGSDVLQLRDAAGIPAWAGRRRAR